jgi:hypothetical protein
MDNTVEAMRARKGHERVFVAKIDPFKGEGIPKGIAQPLDPGVLQGRVVIIVEIIDPDDFLSALQQRVGDG